jgi:excisionase family DNA binding protein
MADDSVESVARLLYRVSEVASALGLSRAKVYELINSGALRAVRIDGARRIKAVDLDAFVASLDEDAALCLPSVGARGGKVLSTGARAMGSGSGCWTWAW